MASLAATSAHATDQSVAARDGLLKPSPSSVLAATVTEAPATAASPAAATATLTDGDVRKVDLEQGKITLKHGPLENLGMPGMTMVFRIDAATLGDIKPCDVVRLRADRVDGAFVVTPMVRR